MRGRLDARTDDVFPTMRPSRAAARGRRAAPPIRNGPAVGAGGRDDGDYNLEAFVPAETTLADQLREHLTLAVADPAQRMIGQYLIDLVDEAGYLSGDLETVAEKLGTAVDEIEAVLASCKPSIRRASARAISPSAWPSS